MRAVGRDEAEGAPVLFERAEDVLVDEADEGALRSVGAEAARPGLALARVLGDRQRRTAAGDRLEDEVEGVGCGSARRVRPRRPGGGAFTGGGAVCARGGAVGATGRGGSGAEQAS